MSTPTDMPRFVPGDESSFDMPDYVPHGQPAVTEPESVPVDVQPEPSPTPAHRPEPLVFHGSLAPEPPTRRVDMSWPQTPFVPLDRSPNPLRGCLWVLVIVFAMMMAGIVVGMIANRNGGSVIPSSPNNKLPTGTPSVRPTNAYPPVLTPAPVVEAIDLLTQPTPGQTWDASGGPVDDGLGRSVYVTPCGVLVTVTSLDFFSTSAPAAAQPSVTGYDIATGTQLWSHSLVALSGFTVPKVNLLASPTFTPDCHMVLGLEDASTSYIGATATVVLDLRTGDAQLVKVGERGVCAAAGDGWLGCWNTALDGHSSGIQAVSLADPNAPPTWWDSAYTTMGYQGDAVVADDIWTPEGYRDPATGWVVFGADTRANNPWTTPPVQGDIIYVEPQRPGGFRSGLVVRVAGDLSADRTSCQVMLWNPQTDQPAWPNAALTTCGRSNMAVVAAGTALIVSHTQLDANMNRSTTTRAYALADGRELWQYEGELDGTHWDAGMAYTNTPYGFSTNYAIGYPNTHLASEPFDMVRIADGTRLHMSGFSLAMVADTMVYRLQRDENGQQQLAAATMDAAGATTPVWTLPIDRSDTDMLIHWTFVTDGKMYLVSSNKTTGLIQVTPLLT